jgi:hypothetical protein
MTVSIRGADTRSCWTVRSLRIWFGLWSGWRTVDSGGLPVVVYVQGTGWGSSDLLDELLEHPRVAAVLWHGEVGWRTAVIALRPGHVGGLGPTARAHELVGQLAFAERGQALVIDAPMVWPDVVAAVTDLVTWSWPTVTQSAAPLLVRWDGAEAGGEHAPAQWLADYWRAVVQVAVVDGVRHEVVSFWPRMAALSPDTLRSIPLWPAFLHPDRLSDAAPDGFTVKAIPAGLLLRHGSAEVPENVMAINPQEQLTVVVAAGPILDPQKTGLAVLHVLNRLFGQWPVSPLVLMPGIEEAELLGTAVSYGLVGSEVAEVMGFGTWTIDHGELKGDRSGYPNERAYPLWRLASNGVWFTPPGSFDVLPDVRLVAEVERFAVPSGTVVWRSFVPCWRKGWRTRCWRGNWWMRGLTSWPSRARSGSPWCAAGR